ncbi:MAG: DUF4387 family protein [Lentilitoribacter sp.]
MARLRDKAEKVRSKNAGPFWLTIDIFCGEKTVFQDVCEKLPNIEIANVLDVDETELKRFEISSLNVVKISLPRPQIQGSIRDRDMHGASWAAIIGEMEI